MFLVGPQGHRATGPQGHGGGGFDLVLVYFLAMPIFAIRHVLSFGLNQSIVVQGVIFLITFCGVAVGMFLWDVRKRA